MAQKTHSASSEAGRSTDGGHLEAVARDQRGDERGQADEQRVDRENLREERAA